MNVLTPGGPPRLKVLVLEFGGVLAEDGLLATLRQLATQNRVDPDVVIRYAQQALHDTGYLVGTCGHADFWIAMQKRFPLRGRPAELSDMVVQHYAVRPRIIAAVRIWRTARLRAVLWADNTDWLDRFEARNRVFGQFDKVISSFHLHRTKRDPQVFADVAKMLGVQPVEMLVVDTSPDVLDCARKQGCQTMLFNNPDRFLMAFEETLGRNAVRA